MRLRGGLLLTFVLLALGPSFCVTGCPSRQQAAVEVRPTVPPQSQQPFVELTFPQSDPRGTTWPCPKRARISSRGRGTLIACESGFGEWCRGGHLPGGVLHPLQCATGLTTYRFRAPVVWAPDVPLTVAVIDPLIGAPIIYSPPRRVPSTIGIPHW